MKEPSSDIALYILYSFLNLHDSRLLQNDSSRVLDSFSYAHSARTKLLRLIYKDTQQSLLLLNKEIFESSHG